MNAYLESMAAVLANVRVYSSTSYSWFGQRNPLLPKIIRTAISPSYAREYVLYGLQRQLYHNYYCPGAAVPGGTAVVGNRASGRSEFIEELSAANNGTGSRDPGWRVDRVDREKIVVERSGLRLWLKPDQVAPVGDRGYQRGAPVSLLLPKENLKLSPGFYVSLGDEGLAPRRSDPVVRVYWNITAEEAPQLIEAATTRLNAARVPFRLKVVNDPDRYGRCDAAVLYVPKRCYPGIVDAVATMYREMHAPRQHGTPAFTKTLAPGLGLAEDPGTGDSFGMHRCRLLAEGILRAQDEGRRSSGARLEAVVNSFAAAGVSSDEPFLNSGSADTYVELAKR